MKITDIKIFEVKKEGNLKASVSITFDDSFIVKNFKVMNGSKGLFVSMPNSKQGEEYKDTAFPITKEFREYIINSILKKYNENNNSGNNNEDDESPF